MTKLLEKGIDAVRALPARHQDMVGELLLALAGTEQHPRLAPEQIADLKLAIAEADAGDVVDESDLADTWKKFGL